MDWHKIRPWGTSKQKSFEELCYQIAKTLHEDQGTFTSIDDSGGGDGVEFYLTFEDGSEWGWQAKFHLPGDRLVYSSRKRKIKNSLHKALEEHPRLTKWFLCTPMTFTPDEIAWFRGRNTQGKKVAGLPDVLGGRVVKLEHWNESDIGQLLTEPRFSGKQHYFFGDLELDHGWFERQLDAQRPRVQHEYDEGLHVPTNVDRVLASYLAEPAALQPLQENLKELDLLRMHAEALWTTDLAPTAEPHVGAAFQAWRNEAEQCSQRLHDVLAALGNADTRRARSLAALSLMDALETASREFIATFRAPLLPNGILRDQADMPEQRTRRQVAETVAFALDRAGGVSEWLSWSLSSVLHLHGDAGRGKTHVAFDVCAKRVAQGQPALFLSARRMNAERSLTEQLRTLLDVPPAYSFDDMLGALAASAEAHRARLPIVIDGLNEVGPMKHDNVWCRDLESLIAAVARYPSLLLITTCRTTYLQAIGLPVKLTPSNHVHQVFGFDAFDVDEAIKRYFARYGLTGDLSSVPRQHFEHPLYLRIFCEAHASQDDASAEVFFGEVSLYDVFKKYLARVNETIRVRVNLRPGQNILAPIVTRIAEKLWTEQERSVSFDDFMTITDDSTTAPWHGSKAQAILEEGLVASKDFHDGAEHVSFTYDLLGGSLIARYLLEQHSADLQAFLQAPDTRQALLGEGGDPHPLAEDIGRSLAALCEAMHERHLHDVAGVDGYERFVLRTVFEMPSRRVGERELLIARTALNDPRRAAEALSYSASVLLIPRHPLNASFLSSVLSDMPVTLRDRTWTEAIREDAGRLQTFLRPLGVSAPTSTVLTSEQFDLHAEVVAWMQTSTKRTVRDLATRSLRDYARQRSEAFLALFERLVRVNDPYVVERMLAAALGAVIAVRLEPPQDAYVALYTPNLARATYAAFFAPGAPAATTHVLARAYARRLLTEVQRHHPTMLTPEEAERAHGPSPVNLRRAWGRSSDANAGRYWDGNAPIHLDFAKYVLPNLLDARLNPDANNPSFQDVLAGVWWRIYDLGYRFDDFAGIDAEIAGQNVLGRSDDGRKTERYGKKYAWIAYHELAGVLFDDKRLALSLSWFADIDPSFPAPPRRQCVVEADWLGLDETDTAAWIAHGGMPDVRSLLVHAGWPDMPGKWVLLDGHVTFEDEALQRERFMLLRAFIVGAADVNVFVTYVMCPTFARDALPRTSTIEGVYAVDLPPAPYIEDEEPEQSEVEATDDTAASEAVLAFLEQLRSSAAQGVSDEPGSQVEQVAPDVPVPRRFVDERLNVLVPVVDATGGTAHSFANPSWSVTVPARDLVDALNLQPTPGTFDYVGGDGEVLGVYLQAGEGSGDRQDFTYLRRDALETYLQARDARLVWVVWGERGLSTNARLGSVSVIDSPMQEFARLYMYEPGGKTTEWEAP